MKEPQKISTEQEQESSLPKLRVAWLGRDFDGFGFEGKDGQNILLYLNAEKVAKIEKLISADSPGV